MAARPLVSLTVLFAVVVSVVAGGTAVAGATTQAGNDDVLTVDDDGSADHTTIQDAVDAASPGDTIRVAAGTYDGEVVVDKNVTLRADGDARLLGKQPLVGDDGAVTLGAGPPYGFKLAGGADGTTIRGFTIDYFASGILVSGNLENVTLVGNDIEGAAYNDDRNSRTSQVAINITPQPAGVVRNLTIEGNDISRLELPSNACCTLYREGVVFEPAEDARFEDLRIRENNLESGAEIRLGAGSTIEGFVLENNQQTSAERFNSIDILTTEEDFRAFPATVRDVSIRKNTGNALSVSVGPGRLENVTARNNDVSELDFTGERGATLTDIRVVENKLTSGDGFIFLTPGINSRMTDVLVRDNTATSVSVFTSGGDVYEDITIVENDLSANVYMDAFGGAVRNVTISRNRIENNDLAVYFATYGRYEGEGTTVEDVDITDNDITILEDGGPFEPEAMFISPAGDDTWTDFNVSGNVVDLRDEPGDPSRDGFRNGNLGVFFGAYEGFDSPTLDGVRFEDNLIRGANTSLYVSVIGSDSYDLQVAGNTITNGDRGVLFFEDDTGGSATGRQLTIEGNVIDSMTLRGVGLYGPSDADTFPETDPAADDAPATVELRRNQLSNNEVGVEVINIDPDGVTLRRNNLLSNDRVAVLNKEPRPVDARRNYWDASDGPSSLTESPLADPETGALANGTGDALSADPDDTGVTAVRFDPFATEPIDLEAPVDPEPDPPDTPDRDVRDEPEPRFVYEGTIDPKFIDAGETTVVNVTVTNEGDAAGEYEGQLSTGFDGLVARPGELGPGESQNLSFEVSFAEVSINQLFVDGDYIGDVEVEQPSPAELTRRHLEVEGAYTNRWAVTEGSTYEIVVTVRNTDDEAHEFEIPFETYRTDAPADSRIRTVETTQSVVLRSGERRTLRQEVTVDEAVEGPRGATAFVADVPASNMTVVPESELPSGLTKAYTVPSDANGYEYEVVAVYHNPGDTAETFTATLFPPRYEENLPLLEVTDMFRVESVTVQPGETRRLRVGVDTARSSGGQGVWTVDGRPAPLVVDAEAE